MRRSPRILIVLAAAVVCALVMSGCGSGSAGSGPGAGPDDAVAADTRSVSPGATSPAVASFQGTVSDAQGRPVGGVLLQASSLATPPLPVPELAVLTDASGHYAWLGLRPGPYAVSASQGAGSARAQITVVDGASASADLVLR